MNGEKSVIIIGGGASGMMAAIKAAESDVEVILIEKNRMCGRKILLTGKGRCNITNTKNWEFFSSHLFPKPMFLRSAFFDFSNLETIGFFNKIGLRTVVTQGERVFPESMRSQDVVDILVSKMKKEGVKVLSGHTVVSIDKCDNLLFECSCSVEGSNIENKVYGKAVIIATGGLSYPVTGSTGDGYKFASNFGHSIDSCFPSLTAITPENYDRRLEGINLDNVSLSLFVNKDLIQSEQGDLSFTNGGIEGSLGFRVSRKAVHSLLNGNKVEVVIDIKPSLSIEKIADRIERELKAQGYNRKSMNGGRLREYLRGYMPLKLIDPFIESNVNLSIDNLPERLKHWSFKIAGYVGYQRSVITAGGIPTTEIVAKNMRSKIVEGLFFAGEIIDIDGDTGGYNLQIAFSTGSLAGKSAAQYILK